MKIESVLARCWLGDEHDVALIHIFAKNHYTYDNSNANADDDDDDAVVDHNDALIITVDRCKLIRMLRKRAGWPCTNANSNITRIYKSFEFCLCNSAHGCCRSSSSIRMLLANESVAHDDDDVGRRAKIFRIFFEAPSFHFF